MVNATANLVLPKRVHNWIGGCEQPHSAREFLEKRNPCNGELQSQVTCSTEADIDRAVEAAGECQPRWAQLTVVERGRILRRTAALLEERASTAAQLVSLETGKSPKDAAGEVQAAVEMGYFIAGEGRRYYGRTTTSAVENRSAMTIRQPIGLCGLIVAANTPLANVAWKAFPALLCGNAAILKAAEDTPQTANFFASILAEAGAPAGVFNVVHGLGSEAGSALVRHPDVGLISFTGSTQVGRSIQSIAGPRLAKVCLELGGKNPLIVCDDADLARAADVAILSAFSNAGQRCAAGSRIIVFASVYAQFRQMLLERAEKLRVGNTNQDDLGPVINERQLQRMLAAVTAARQRGAKALIGGHRLTDPLHAAGYFMAPTLLEQVDPDDEISRQELFGPIACLYQAPGFQQAIDLCHRSSFGLTAAIHTRDMNRAMTFLAQIKSGVACVNGPTFGSEPHLPFGGLRDSGNGFREAGSEVLDVYSDWKAVYIHSQPQFV